MNLLLTTLYSVFPSPDSSGKPFAGWCIFSWQKKATGGSSFCALEKNNKTKKLGTDSWNSF